MIHIHLFTVQFCCLSEILTLECLSNILFGSESCLPSNLIELIVDIVFSVTCGHLDRPVLQNLIHVNVVLSYRAAWQHWRKSNKNKMRIIHLHAKENFLSLFFSKLQNYASPTTENTCIACSFFTYRTDMLCSWNMCDLIYSHIWINLKINPVEVWRPRWRLQ